jgi:hypothetical protein
MNQAYTYDIAVAWRIYPGVSKTPLIFPDDKLQLARTCLLSFKACVGDLRMRYYFILDGCPDTYEQMIREIFPAADITINHTPGIGNLSTFRKQVDVLLQQQDAPLVYFAEDDYLYLPGQFYKMVRLLHERNDVDFVTPYLHPDSYNHPIHRHPKQLFHAANHLWMTESSTCLTFLTRKETLEAAKDELLTYSRGNNDCAMWLTLTKTHVLNPIAYLRYAFSHKESFGILKMALKHSSRYFLRRRFVLAMPVPAIGTHLEKDLVSPGTDWLQVSNALQDSNSSLLPGIN